MIALTLVDLASLPRRVVWRPEIRNGKGTKVPICARDGLRAKSGDPSTWATRAEAETAVPTRSTDMAAELASNLGKSETMSESAGSISTAAAARMAHSKAGPPRQSGGSAPTTKPRDLNWARKHSSNILYRPFPSCVRQWASATAKFREKSGSTEKANTRQASNSTSTAGISSSPGSSSRARHPSCGPYSRKRSCG